MTTCSEQWIILAASVVLTNTIFGCSGTTSTHTTQETNVISRTTHFPTNPYVFSPEDYKILQNTEDIGDPVSIIRYEPQKINSKDLEQKSFIKGSQMGLSTEPLDTEIQMPQSKRFYKFPRRHTRTTKNVDKDSGSQQLSTIPTTSSSPLPFTPTNKIPSLAKNLVLENEKLDQKISETKNTDVRYSSGNSHGISGVFPTNVQDYNSVLQTKLNTRIPQPFTLSIHSAVDNKNTPTESSYLRQFKRPSTIAERHILSTASTKHPNYVTNNPINLSTAYTSISTHVSKPILESNRYKGTGSSTSKYSTSTVKKKLGVEYLHPKINNPSFLIDYSTQPTFKTKDPSIPSRRERLLVVTTANPVQIEQLSPPSLFQNQQKFNGNKDVKTQKGVSTKSPYSPKRYSARISSPPMTENPMVTAKQMYLYTDALLKSADGPENYDDVVIPPTVAGSQTNVQPENVTIKNQLEIISEKSNEASESSEEENRNIADLVSDEENNDSNFDQISHIFSDEDRSISNISDENIDRIGENDYQDNSDDNDNKETNRKPKDNNYSYNYTERSEEPIRDTSTETNNLHPVTEKVVIIIPKTNINRAQQKYVSTTKSYSAHDQVPDQNEQKSQIKSIEKQENTSSKPQDLEVEADHTHQKKHHKNKKEHKPSKDHKSEEEGAHQHHEGNHSEEGEKGEKGYKEIHEHDDHEKGHHDKDIHHHHYHEKMGDAKKHHKEAGYHEEHKKGEEGEKKGHFSEKGKHNKGHSTKGEHVIHKKDEYNKKIEFFDESDEGGDSEKVGGHHEEHHHKKGGHHKKGQHHHGHEKKHHGHKGHHKKGHHHHSHKGHDKKEGHHEHHRHDEKHGKKSGHEAAKQWHHKKSDKR